MVGIHGAHESQGWCDLVEVGYHRAMEEDPGLAQAFVDLHGERLHGFALLVTLGDVERASVLSAEVLELGVARIDQLRHPERAGAWLRAALTQAARGPAWGHQRPDEAERRQALRRLGVDDATFDALAVLDVRSRAAVVASSVEGFSAADVYEIAGGDGRVRRARRDYLAAYLAATAVRGATPPAGELAARVRATAAPVLPGSNE